VLESPDAVELGWNSLALKSGRRSASRIICTMGHLTWGHMIWIYMPLPLVCLLLLALPLPQSLERLGTRAVGSLFFSRVSIGPMEVALVHLFIFTSFLICMMATRTINAGFGNAHVPCGSGSCPFHSGETLFYRRAARYRAERNFWLSLFTFVLWLLVYKIHALKEQVVQLKSDVLSRKNPEAKKDD